MYKSKEAHTRHHSGWEPARWSQPQLYLWRSCSLWPLWPRLGADRVPKHLLCRVLVFHLHGSHMIVFARDSLHDPPLWNFMPATVLFFISTTLPTWVSQCFLLYFWDSPWPWNTWAIHFFQNSLLVLSTYSSCLVRLGLRSNFTSGISMVPPPPSCRLRGVMVLCWTDLNMACRRLWGGGAVHYISW